MLTVHRIPIKPFAQNFFLFIDKEQAIFELPQHLALFLKFPFKICAKRQDLYFEVIKPV
jgi:hypothetical protein